MVSFEMNDRKKIGLGLTGFGIFFTCLGMAFFFDKGLLAMGNILFLSGVTLTIGFKPTMQFFMKRQNYKGTISFGIGFFFVIIGWPIIGMILEAYGFIVLFRSLGFFFTVIFFILIIYFCMHDVADGICCAAASGQHWQFFFRRFQFLAGCFNNHTLDHSLTDIVADGSLCKPGNRVPLICGQARL